MAMACLFLGYEYSAYITSSQFIFLTEMRMGRIMSVLSAFLILMMLFYYRADINSFAGIVSV